ncbi:flavin-containing monooxygenase [Cupriavidus sp. CP313]
MNKSSQPLDVIVVGAGQAGLASGWHLKQHGLRFLIVDEQQQAGGNWRNYYDSLRLFSPAAYSSLPGLPFSAAANHYPRRDEVSRYLEDYAAHFRLPVRPNTRIERVRKLEEGFQLRAANGQRFHSRALLVASGAFSRPYIPDIQGLEDFRGRVLHSAEYRAPAGISGQHVVVVGAANSAVQIAYELACASRVTMATREPIRFAPQRILGVDFHAWLKWTGLEKTRWLNDQSTPVLDDGTYRNAIKQGLVTQKPMFRGVTSEGVIWPDGRHEKVDSLLFATGFRPNLSFLRDLPVLGNDGLVAQRSGIARHVPGLFFVGLPRQRNFASATLRGVGPDAEHLLPDVIRHLGRGTDMVGN